MLERCPEGYLHSSHRVHLQLLHVPVRDLCGDLLGDHLLHPHLDQGLVSHPHDISGACLHKELLPTHPGTDFDAPTSVLWTWQEESNGH